ncbi:hypothetical protein ElyMa_004377700, partial [Elysia marginata]
SSYKGKSSVYISVKAMRDTGPQHSYHVHFLRPIDARLGTKLQVHHAQSSRLET